MNRKTTGFHPFWFWNGDMEIGEIRRQIDLMAGQGINGFFIHFRQGMTLPYLSETFFTLLRQTAEYARDKGLTAHIYDEYPYPSGSAGGFVTLGRPEFRGTHLLQKNYSLSGGSITLSLPEGHILNATLVPLKEGRELWDSRRDVTSHIGMVLVDHTFHAGGLTSYNQKRYFASRPVPTLKMELEKGEYTLCVSLQTEQDRFKYWGTLPDVLNREAMDDFLTRTHRAYAEHFGDELSSLFFSSFTDEVEPEWSACLPKKYRETYGEDLYEKLPALIHDRYPGADGIRQKFYRLKYTLFEESFEKPVSRWCREQGIRYCGEKPSLYLRQMKHMAIPGCDPGHTKAGRIPDILKASLRANARACASAAQFYEKEGCLCECYHSLGWSGTLLDGRIIAESLLLMGITMLVPHGYFYTTHGLTKHDAPPTFFFQMPYWPLTHLLSEKVAHIQKAFEETRIRADIFLYDPTGSLPTKEEKDSYEKLMYTLAGRQLDFLMVDPGIIEELDGDLTGKTLLVLDTVSEEPEKAGALASFTSRGGRVHLIKSPEDLDGADLAPCLSFSLAGRNPERLWMVTREKRNEEHVYFFLNTGDSPLEISFSQKMDITEFPGANPRIKTLSHKSVAPFESFLAAPSLKVDEIREQEELILIHIPGELNARPLGKNYLRLESWEMELNGEKHTLKAAPLINQIDEGDYLWKPAVNHYFGWMPDLEASPQSVVYRREIVLNDSGASEGTELMIEPGSLRGNWKLRLNGKDLGSGTNLETRDYPVRGTGSLSLEKELTRGRNILEIFCDAERLDDGLVSPLYLAGDFLVNQDDSLSSAPSKDPFRPCRFDDYRQMGIPYYSGRLLYRFEFEYNRTEESRGKTLIELLPPVPFQDAMEISLNEGPFLPAPWMPYRIETDSPVLKEGKNMVELRVSTSLIRTFEGTRFDIGNHRYEEC